MFIARTPFLLIVGRLGVLLVSCLCGAQCPYVDTGPRWAWDSIYFYNYSGESIDALGAAAGSWSDFPGYIFIYENDGHTGLPYADIPIYDDSSLPMNVLGQTGKVSELFNYDCACMRNYCDDYCGDATMMYYAEIDFNRGVIDLLAATYNVSYADAFMQVATHEFGHVLGLADVTNPPAYSCDDLQSIMYYEADLEIQCGWNHPSPCDGAGVLEAYPGFPEGCHDAPCNAGYCETGAGCDSP